MIFTTNKVSVLQNFATHGRDAVLCEGFHTGCSMLILVPQPKFEPIHVFKLEKKLV